MIISNDFLFLVMIVFLKILAIVAALLLIIVLIIGWLDSPSKEEKKSTLVEDLEPDQDEEPLCEFEGNVAPKRILTDSEVYNLERIIDNLPDGVMICPQVSFNAFIDCKKMNLRNQFNRKSVDYLILDNDFNPLIIIECDDDSHTSKKVRMRDLQRDQIAAAAGIPTLRITNKTPTEELGSLIKEHIQKVA